MPATSQQMNLALIGGPYKNLARAAYSAWYASSEASSSFAVELLGNGAPAETWRSTNPLTSNNILALNVAVFDPGVAKVLGTSGEFSINGFGFSNHNLRAGHGQYRIVIEHPKGDWNDPIGDTDSFLARFETVLPNAILTTNASGAVGDIDNGTTPDGNTVRPTNYALDYAVRAQFASPTDSLLEGAGEQEFWLFVKAGATDGSNIDCDYTEAPAIIVDLYEGGVSKQTLGAKLVTKGANGQWLCFPWNASNLSDLSGAGVECRWTGARNTDTNVNVKVDELFWRMAPTGVYDDSVLDSGWQTYDDPLDGDDSPRTGTGAQQCSFYHDLNNLVLADAGSSYTIVFLFRDDQVPPYTGIGSYGYDITSGEWRDPDGFVEVGTIDVGRLYQSTINFTPGQILDGTYLTQPVESQGGQRYGTSLRTRRKLKLDLEFLTTPEGALLKDRLDRLGPLRTFFVVVYPNSTDGIEDNLMCFPCTVAQPPTYSMHLKATDYPRAVGLLLEEVF